MSVGIWCNGDETDSEAICERWVPAATAKLGGAIQS